MMPRVEYEMTEADLKILLSACEPTPCMNAAWMELGRKMGFDGRTVRPISGKGNRFFTAVPSESEAQRDERLARERDDKRREEVHKLKMEIAERQGRLLILEKAAAAMTRAIP